MKERFARNALGEKDERIEALKSDPADYRDRLIRESSWQEDYFPRFRTLGEILVKSLKLAETQRRLILIALTIAAIFVTLTGCATSQKKTQQQYSGFLKTYPDFVKGPEGIDKRWLKPGVDFSKYDKIMMDEVQFFLAPDADYKGISPSITKELGEDFHKSFVKEMGDMLTASPGPDVARMRLAVTDIEQSKPAVGTITTVVPVGLSTMPCCS